MRRHPIVPRKWLRDGIPNWKVRVPLDLISPHEPKTRNFRDERDAITYAKSLSTARLSLAAKFLKLPQIEQAKVLRRYEEENSQTNVTVQAAGEKCLTAKRDAGRRKNSLVALGCTLRSIGAAIGAKSIQAVAAADIDGWLSSHPEWSPKTKLNNLKYASSLFAWCVRKRMLTFNPCMGVERPVVPFKAVKILTVAQIRQLLKTCCEEDPALLGFLALVLFGGLRVAEARRCKTSNLANNTIDLGGESCKLNERRCVKMSAQLQSWILVWMQRSAAWAEADGGVEVPNFANRLKSLVKLSGVALPRNGLRHSFCSYNLELLGADATARAANNSPTMLFKHYAAMVSKEDAQAFAGILPE